MELEKALRGEYSFHNNPEMALQSYNEFGFHVEKKYFSTEYCDFLIQEANDLSGARANDFKPFLMPHHEKPCFLEAMKNKAGVDILQQMMGGTPSGVQTQFFYCKPGTRGFSLHQDNFYVQAPLGEFVSTWVSLVDTSPKNGGLIVYPESHKEGDLPVRKLNLDADPNQDKNANNEETMVPEKYKAYGLTLQKGDVVFIHSHIVHGSHANNSNDYRYALLNLYIKEGASFRKGNSARREAFALA